MHHGQRHSTAQLSDCGGNEPDEKDIQQPDDQQVCNPQQQEDHLDQVQRLETGRWELSRANKEALDRVADPELAIVEGLPAIFSEQVNKDLFMVKGALAYVKGIHLSANQSPVTDGQTNVFKLKQVNHLILVLDNPPSHLPNGIVVVKPMKSYPSPRSQQRFLVSNFRFNRRLRSLFGRLRANTRPSGDPF